MYYELNDRFLFLLVLEDEEDIDLFESDAGEESNEGEEEGEEEEYQYYDDFFDPLPSSPLTETTSNTRGEQPLSLHQKKQEKVTLSSSLFLHSFSQSLTCKYYFS